MNPIASALRIVALSLLPLLAAPALAASEHDGHGAGSGAAKAPLTEGTILKVDPAAGKIGIAHGPLVNLGMPAMTMVFKVKDSNWLEKMKKGDRIRFRAEKVDGAFTVVRYEPVGK